VYIGAILIGVALINALIEFVQEQQSQKIMQSFLDLVPRKCRGIRNGQLGDLPAADLVPGDVVFVRMGDKLPADIVLFHASEFKVDNSSLTGESEPQERGYTNSQKNPLEATNLAFNGSLCVNGEGYGIVIRTGDSTVLGQIASLAGGEEKRDSPLTIEITGFVHKIAIIAFVFAVVFFGVGWTRNPNISYNLTFAIGVFVSFVPEGLPATVTMLLSIAAKRMANRNVLVKDLKGVETLGAITCLATDKTGTLTRNQMTVTYVWSGNEFFDASSTTAPVDPLAKNKEAESGGIFSSGLDIDRNEKGDDIPMFVLPPQAAVNTFKTFDPRLPQLTDIMQICYLCSKAQFENVQGPIKDRKIIADATEAGLFRFAASGLTESDKVKKAAVAFEHVSNSADRLLMFQLMILAPRYVPQGV
jgi:sodium/potassium-transporting ATPase subunit alpha